jgi:large repetitive protein
MSLLEAQIALVALRTYEVAVTRVESLAEARRRPIGGGVVSAWAGIPRGRGRWAMRLWTLLAAMAALVVFAIAPEANAGGGVAITSCAQLVTTNAFLTQDLYCPGTGGVIVGASGIAIDLKGFTLRGDGFSGYGIDDRSGYDQLAVKNGVVRSFHKGVSALSGADKVSVSGVVASGNDEEGIRIEGASATVNSSTASGNGDSGIFLNGAPVSVNSSTAAGNGQDGLRIFSAAASVKSSKVSGNRGDGISVGGIAAIAATDVSGNGHTGIHTTQSATISASTISGNGGDGVIVDDGPGSSIGATTASGNVRDGIFVAGNGVTISKATVSGNGLTGIDAEGDSASFTALTATGNKDHGVFVNGAFAKIASSIVHGNGDDGIFVLGDGASLTKNSANANGFGPDFGGGPDGTGRGIAVSSSVSGTPVGINTAHGNDDPAECSPSYLC